MKRFYSLLACAASILFVTSCSSGENDVIDNSPKKMTFMVGAPTTDNTRAVIDNLIKKNPGVDWQETDKVFVWGVGSTTANTFSFKQYGNYHNYALFEGTAPEASKYFVMYPNQTGATFDGSSIISATIPHVQKATLMSFDPAAALCTGAVEGQQSSVSIAHACAFLFITTKADCKSITFKPVGNNSNGNPWLVTGDVKLITSSSGCAIDIENSPGGYDYVKLTADGTENCETTFPAGTYVMSIASSTKFPGFEITVDYGLGEYNPHVTREYKKQFEAGFVYNLGIAEVPENAPRPMTLIVGSPTAESETASNSSPTRAVIDDLISKNPGVDWQETDKVFVWGVGSTTANTFSFKQYGNYHNYALFEGTAPEASKYYIMYPNQAGATFDGNGIISATIPHVQKATLMSFDPAAALCTGATEGQEDASVSIAHACAFLRITTVEDCKSITFKPTGTNGNGNPWFVTGDVKLVTSSSGCAIQIEDTANGYNYVKLTADGTENCESTFPAGTYVMAIASSTKFPGFEITVDYGLGENNPHVSRVYTKQFNAGFVYNLGTAEVSTGE